jgi:hypothetical protein
VLHVLLETRIDPVRCSEPHVGRAPACIAAGFTFARFFKQGNLDGQITAARLLGRRERRRETGGAMSDDDQLLLLLQISRHSAHHRQHPLR